MFLKTLWRLRIWYRIKVLRRVLSWSFRHFDFRQLILQLMILPSVDLLVNWPYSQLIFDAIDLFDLWSGGLWPFWPLILLQIIFGQMIFDTIELSTIDLTYRWSLHFWSFWHLTFLQLIFHQLIFFTCVLIQMTTYGCKGVPRRSHKSAQYVAKKSRMIWRGTAASHAFDSDAKIRGLMRLKSLFKQSFWGIFPSFHGGSN